MATRDDFASIWIHHADLSLFIEVRRVCSPETFRSILKRALRGHVYAARADFPLFASLLHYQVIRAFGTQRGHFVRILPTRPVVARWKYEITITRYPFLSIKHRDGHNYFLGPLFKFTKKLPASIRTYTLKQLRRSNQSSISKIRRTAQRVRKREHSPLPPDPRKRARDSGE